MNDKRLHEFSNPFNFTTKDINIVEVYNQKRLTLRKKKLDEKFNNFRKKIFNKFICRMVSILDKEYSWVASWLQKSMCVFI